MTVAPIPHKPTGIAPIGLHLPPLAMAVAWEADMRRDLETRTRISRAEYEKLRG